MDMSELVQKLYDRGVEEVGFSLLKDAVPEPFKELQYGISIMVRLSDAVLDQIEDSPTFTYFHHYRTVNTFIDQTCLWISTMIRRAGYRAVPIPASQSVKIEGKEYHGIFQHKTAAVLSGLGWIGKNGLLINPKHGPRIRLGTVLTNMPQEISKPVMESRCGHCNECVGACPAMALHGIQWKMGMEREEILDPRACSEYMNSHFKHIGRGSVCGLCITACPFGSIEVQRKRG